MAEALDVAFLCQGWAPQVGGIESHTLDLARGLMRQGHSVSVLCLDPTAGLAPFTVRDSEHGGVAVRRMAYAYQGQSELADVLSNPEADQVVLDWLAEQPCDVVHVHHLTGFGTGALSAAHDMGRPLVMTLHDYWLLCPRGRCCAPTDMCASPRARGLRRVHRRDLAAPDARGSGRCRGRGRAHGPRARGPGLAQVLLAPSEAVVRVYGAAGVDPRRCRVIEHGFDAETLVRDYEAARRAGSRDTDELRLGVLGAVQPSKGQLELARVLVAADVPGLTLEVHGELGSYHGDERTCDALRELAAQDARIRLHGAYARGDLPGLLARLDGVAAPSTWAEPYGMTVREARCCGLPVLVSDTGGLSEVVGDFGAGCALAPGDAHAWRRALEQFARPEVRERWASVATDVATIEQMVDATVSCYREVVTGRPPA